MAYAVPVLRWTPKRTAQEVTRGRMQAHPWRAWYNLAAWKRRRREQLMREPLCIICLPKGITRAANTADHVVPHRGDWELFINGRLQSLCGRCHSSVKQRDEIAAGKV